LLARAPVALVIAGVYETTAVKYGRRATRYVDFEAGCAAQNAALQAVALGLGTVVVGAFDDARVQSVVGLAGDERPLCILPAGRE
jgi:SagB-type dehydrogenase family enzyme